MRIEEFSQQIEAIRDRLRGWDRECVVDDFDARSLWEQARSTLDVTIEGMRAAEEELRQQGEELEESRRAVEAERRRYRDLFDFAPDGYLVTDEAGVIREANRSAGELLGLPAGWLRGQPLAAFIPLEERSSFRGGLNRLRRAGRREGWLVRIEPRHRPAFQVSLTAEVIPGGGGVRWSLRDVTELVRGLCPEAVDGGAPRPGEAEGAGPGAGRADDLRDLLDGAGVIVWEADAATGGYTFISPRAEQMLGYPAGRWLSDPTFWLSIIHPEDRELVRSGRLACADDGRSRELEYRILAEDGRVTWFRETLRPATAGEGRPAALRGCLWDITRRKKVERRLYTDRGKLAERLADVSHLDSLQAPLLATIDLVPVLEEVLAGVASLLGAELGAIRLLDRERGDLEAVVSLGLSSAYLEAYGRLAVGVGACGLAVERGDPVVVEEVESDPEARAWGDAARLGGYRSAFSVPLVARGGEVMGAVAAFFRDPHRPSPRQIRMVEQYVLRASDAVDNARRHLDVRQADRRKEGFFAAVAHELRTPLAAIRDWAQFLGSGPDDEGASEAREVIVRQAGIMSRLVDDLLDAPRMRRGAIALRNEPVDLAALAARTAADLRPLIESRGQQLEVALPEGPAWIEGDRTRLGQVLTNLLTNAAKYTDPGGRIDLIASGDRGAGEVVLRVRDTGIGLAPEAPSHIFELFAQAEPARDRDRGGLGIGLALVKTLVELHGGTVSASSPGPGRGSEFVVRLPARGRSARGDRPRCPEPERAAPVRATDSGDRAERESLEGQRTDAA